jgi:hypothetical protein
MFYGRKPVNALGSQAKSREVLLVTWDSALTPIKAQAVGPLSVRAYLPNCLGSILSQRLALRTSLEDPLRDALQHATLTGLRLAE